MGIVGDDDCAGILIGGVDSTQGNTIFENNLYGIILGGSGHTIQGNEIGQNGEEGVFLVGDDNEVLGNSITFNKENGILIWGTNNDIEGNDISDNGGNGVEIGDGSSFYAFNTVGSSFFVNDPTKANFIARNSENGIFVHKNATSNTFRLNSILCNDSYGISLDTGFGGTDANAGIEVPEVLFAGGNFIEGKGIPGYIVDVYLVRDSCDFSCSGADYLATVTVDSDSIFRINESDLGGNVFGLEIALTQTNGSGNTSEFTCGVADCSALLSEVAPSQNFACKDGVPDVITFFNDIGGTLGPGGDYAYMIIDIGPDTLDAADLIVGVPADSTFDFDLLPVGNYVICGISYSGTLSGLTVGLPNGDIDPQMTALFISLNEGRRNRGTGQSHQHGKYQWEWRYGCGPLCSGGRFLSIVTFDNDPWEAGTGEQLCVCHRY